MTDSLFTVAELAFHLNVSRWTIYRLLREKSLQSTRIRGAIRFTPQQVERLLSSATKEKKSRKAAVPEVER
jgi:excisionase family DNA binding protein